MPSKYEIKILRDKEFFKVAKSDPRYSEVDETNLGFADPEKGRAYVRQTYWPDLNKGLLLHEFEHLVENDCPKGRAHQDQHGIKHKKFFKEGIAQPLAKLGEKFTPEWSRKLPIMTVKNACACLRYCLRMAKSRASMPSVKRKKLEKLLGAFLNTMIKAMS